MSARIQQALIRTDNATISAGELAAASYGDSTAAAVLDYKNIRGIINRAYQTTSDNIVGKLTIRSLDDEMQALEASMMDDFGGAALRPVFGRLI